MPVQDFGDMECKNGHRLTTEVYCEKCNPNLYWVDGDARYVICKGCNEVRKMSEELVCGGCNAKIRSNIKWVPGYKP